MLHPLPSNCSRIHAVRTPDVRLTGCARASCHSQEPGIDARVVFGCWHIPGDSPDRFMQGEGILQPDSKFVMKGFKAAA